jgi:cell division initiation protein
MSMRLEEAKQVLLKPKRGRYEQREVDSYVASLLAGYEDVTRERDELRERATVLESELSEVRELEREFRESLVAAQRVAKELREEAERERNEIVKGAHDEVAGLRQAMEAERQRLEAGLERVREVDAQVKTGYKQFLAAALELLDEASRDAASAKPAERRDVAELSTGPDHL